MSSAPPLPQAPARQSTTTSFQNASPWSHPRSSFTEHAGIAEVRRQGRLGSDAAAFPAAPM